MRGLAWLGLLMASACAGPPATDAELCRDVIHRLCISRCPSADTMLGLTASSDCTAVLTTRTGCGSDDFMFQSRSNFLSCRTSILRNGDEVETVPACEDVDDMFRLCPSVLTFFGGM